MSDTIEVYGNEESIDGVIVGFHPESSGFIYEGTFEEQDLDDLGYNLVIEVADIEPDRLVYFPVENNKLKVDSKENSFSPIVKNSKSIETKTVVIQHPILESANIRTVEKLREEAYEYLDSEYPSHVIWKELRGCEISCSGVELNDMIIANFVSIKEYDEMNIGDEKVVKHAKKLVEDKYHQKMKDKKLNCYQLLKIDNTIMTVSYYINEVRLGDDSAMEGILELTDDGFRIVDEIR